jgi:hypothetical protein
VSSSRQTQRNRSNEALQSDEQSELLHRVIATAQKNNRADGNRPGCGIAQTMCRNRLGESVVVIDEYAQHIHHFCRQRPLLLFAGWFTHISGLL